MSRSRSAVRAAVAVLSLVLAAPPVAADTPQRAAEFLAVMRAHGCAMTEDTAEQVLPGRGFTRDEVRGFVEILVGGGHAVLDSAAGALRLSPGLCAAAPEGDAALFAPSLSPDDAAVLRVRTAGDAGVREMLVQLAAERSCAIDLSDRAAAMKWLADTMLIRLRLGPMPGSQARAEIETLIAAALDAPGPAYRTGPDGLVLIDCNR